MIESFTSTQIALLLSARIEMHQHCAAHVLHRPMYCIIVSKVGQTRPIA